MIHARLASTAGYTAPLILLIATGLLNCSNDDNGSSTSGEGGTSNAGGATSSGTANGGTANATAGGATSVGGRNAGASNSGGSSSGGSNSGGNNAGGVSTGTANVGGGSSTGVKLPNGGLEYRNIVNLVDAQAVAVMDDYLTSASRYGGTAAKNIDRLVQIFYELYDDDYDYVIYLNDHDLPTGPTGLFRAANRPPLFGTGQIPQVVDPQIWPPNLKGTIAIKLDTLQQMPPFAHEILHLFANHLDQSFGFGFDKATDYGAHWGISSVHGQLGGFDANTLRCETPAGEKPPNCTKTAAGRYHYLVEFFAPNTYVKEGTNYAPLELYLMGLIPAAEVTTPLQVINDVVYDVDNPTLAADRSVVLDAAGISTVSITDIVARHGERHLLDANERNIRAAFVLLTSSAASQTYLDAVADFAAIFGGDKKAADSTWKSYSELTGGRGTLTWKIGKRRDPSVNRQWEPIVIQDCNVTKQNCPSKFACYGTSTMYCADPGTKTVGQECLQENECVKGLECIGVAGNSSKFVCAPFCDPGNASGSNACDMVCPEHYIPLEGVDGTTQVAALCYGGAGSACDPLVQNCPNAGACTGTETPTCQIPGTLAKGADCSTNPTGCSKGTTCVGIQGSSSWSCQAYCDPSTTASTAVACSSVCANGSWTMNGFGLCMPSH